MRNIVLAYHSLIDREYEKYRTNQQRIEEAYLTESEAINAIMASLRCSQDDAKKILDKLTEMGFMVLNGQGKIRSLHFDLAYRASNITVEYGSLRYPLETKIYVRDEKIPSFEDHKFEEIASIVPSEIYPIIKHALYRDPKGVEGLGDIEGFSDFQFKAIESILKGDKAAYVLMAPTSGGKTFAFFIPALIQILNDKIREGEERSIKVLLIYPRKSLERDQFNKILAVLYRVNQYFQIFGPKNVKVTIAIDDGETPWKNDVESDSSFRGTICPACGSRGKEGGELKYIRTAQGIWIRCSHCGTRFDWILSYREEIWEKKPDILLTNVWTLDWRIPSKTIQHDYAIFKNLRMVILDEAHVYQSLLGGNVRYLIKRLKISSGTQPIIIISSATISKPNNFARDLLDLDPEREIAFIESKEKGENKKVIYLIMAVNPLRSWETVVYELALLLGTIHYYRKMQGVIFIDSIRELYRVFHQSKVAAIYYNEPKDHFNQKLVPDPADSYAYWPYAGNFGTFDSEKTPKEIFQRIMLHHAGIKDREKIERDFVDGKLGALLSTSTLELGVDYPNVTFITIVGVPFMLESIPQRIGRAGRSPEKTLYTTLSIIVLRNTPMELYYLYNPEVLIEGFRAKDIPVAWKNVAVKRYQVFSLLLDEIARRGENTYILSTDGKISDLKTFLNKIMETSSEVKDLLSKLDASVRKEEDIKAEILLQELLEEFNKLPRRVEEWKKLNDCIFEIGELFDLIKIIARRALKLGKKTNDNEIVELSRNLFKVLRGLCP